MNKCELDFTIFCIENTADKLNINGTILYDLLTAKSKILYEYIIPNYTTLHTQSKEYIVNDLIEYMTEEGLIK